MTGVAELLGVKFGEVFKIADDDGTYNFYFRLTEENGIEYSEDNTYWEQSAATILRDLLLGDVRINKLPWKPQKEEIYCIPYISLNEKEMYDKSIWFDDNTDMMLYNMGLVCKTKDEAIALTKKMLAVAKEKNKND